MIWQELMTVTDASYVICGRGEISTQRRSKTCSQWCGSYDFRSTPKLFTISIRGSFFPVWDHILIGIHTCWNEGNWRTRKRYDWLSAFNIIYKSQSDNADGWVTDHVRHNTNLSLFVHETDLLGHEKLENEIFILSHFEILEFGRFHLFVN